MSAVNCQAGEAQLSVEVLPADIGVQFIFRNAGPAAASITDVYFDDGTLLALAFVQNGPGVSFSQMARPRELPGAEYVNPAFNTTADFSADSNPPVQPSGVNPGETLSIYFTLQDGHDVNSVLADLTSAELRIGLHVQGFGDGGSESFVNTPIPLPPAIWLMLSGLASLGAVARRRAVR